MYRPMLLLLLVLMVLVLVLLHCYTPFSPGLLHRPAVCSGQRVQQTLHCAILHTDVKCGGSKLAPRPASAMAASS